jgi:OOP family OmpA-OmpF porin
MASKKYMFILGLISLFSSAAFSQRSDAGYDWRDSSKISTKLMPQQSEFLNNQYPYPARPRSQWELGLSGGGTLIIGDIDPTVGVGVGISARKALNHTFSARIGYIGSITTGLDYRLRNANTIPGNVVGDPWKTNYGGVNDRFVANYRNKAHQAHIDMIASLFNTSYYRGNPKSDGYLFAGYSFLSMDVDVNALGNGQKYDFSSINFNGKRKDIKEAIRNLPGWDTKDGGKGGDKSKYESNAGVLNGSRANVNVTEGNGKQVQRHAISGGAGFAHKLSNKISLGIEQRFTFAFDDNLDGITSILGNKANDLLSYTSLRMNINMGSKSKNVQPLWWLNPNNFIYNELNSPQHMKIPTPVLPDADGDGVTDQFDMEPNTPQGAPVDVRGVSKDTDGDGVPDFKDKELLTSQKCFPVDADGVGTCPEPACCTELRDAMKNWQPANACAIGNLPSVQFRNRAVLSKDAQAVLASAAAQIKANPTCKIRVTGYGASSKSAQQLSWDRVNAVIKYLVEKQGIGEDRFIFSYGSEGDPATVDLMGTTEEGPNNIPAPHPNLKRG